MNLVSIKGSEKPELKMTHTIHSPDIPWQAGWYIPLQNCSYYLHLYLPSLFVAKVFEDLRMISVGLSALYGRICTLKGDESETTILGIHKAVAGVLPNPSICTGAETRAVQGRKPSKIIKYEISSLANKKRIRSRHLQKRFDLAKFQFKSFYEQRCWSHTPMQGPFPPLRCWVIELRHISDSLISFLLGISLPPNICFIHLHELIYI